MPGMLDAFVARMAGGPQKQPRKLTFGVASGGDGVKRPLSYQIAQQIMGQRQSGGTSATPKSPSKPSGRTGNIMHDAGLAALSSMAKKK